MEKNNGSCYVVGMDWQTWEAAQEHCRREYKGGYLVQIGSEMENKYVASLQRGTDLWIGLSKTKKNRNKWMWSQKEVLRLNPGYQDWETGEPNDKGGNGPGRCAYILGSRETSKWDDIGCFSKLWFVCERGEPKRNGERKAAKSRLTDQWRSWWGCLCGVCRRKGVRGLCPREIFFVFLPKQWGFCKIPCTKKITTQENPLPDDRLKTFFKKSCVCLKDS